MIQNSLQLKTTTLLVRVLAILLFLSSALFAQDELTKKIMMGYQGWFLCGGDNSPVNDWRHWFHSSNDPSIDQINIDNWPDMSEYSQSYLTDMIMTDGSPVRLFSSHDSSTTNLHFKWMRDYNVYGVYLQRFLGEAVGDSRFFQVRNNVLQNVIHAAATYDRHFALMYDVTGVPEAGFFDKLVNDWQYLVDNYDLLNQPGYVKQDSLPVVAIWGMGFTHNECTAATAQKVLDYFHKDADPKYRAYVMGGVPSYWRTLSNDSYSDAAWGEVYRSFDMISPWTVGRYQKDGVDNWKNQMISPDLAACTSEGIDYMPVIFPGGSWFNLSSRVDSSRINDNKRDGGKFYWHQAYNAISAGVEFIYVAMFDEVDEGTAMFKLAPNHDQLPSTGSFTTLDADGYDLPSDWYLQLANYSQQMLEGEIPLSNELPITPATIPVTSISVDLAEVILPVAGTVQLKYAILPSNAYNQTVIWKSSDDGVAIVSDRGKVEGAGLGNATITATTEDGGFTATCQISIVEGSPVSKVTVEPRNGQVDVDKTFQLTATIEPEDAVNKTLVWFSSDMKIATVDQSGLVTGVSEGDAVISARSQDGAKIARSRITVINSSQQPFHETPIEIEGTLEAEDYDIGGEGVAYHDADPLINNGNQYRTDEGVDVETCSAGGYNVGWINSGEWLEYTVNVTVGGTYTVDAYVATELNGAKFHLEFDGRTKGGIVNVPSTGGWQTWDYITIENVTLPAGVQVMRIFRETDGADFNLDRLEFFLNGNAVEDGTQTPNKLDLMPAFPNPFNASTTIKYSLDKAANVKLQVFDLLGKEIVTLYDGKEQAGEHTLQWHSLDSYNRQVASGIYFIRMQTNSFEKVQKILLVK